MEQTPNPMPAVGQNPAPAAGQSPVPHTPQAAARPRKIYAIDGKDRILLPLAWGLGVLWADLLFQPGGIPGLGVTVLVAAWYAVFFWYGGVKGFARRENVLLLAAAGVLALCFALYSNQWFRIWNLRLLAVLLPVQAFGCSGAARLPWSRPAMLRERFVLLLDGLFCRLGAPVQALGSLGKKAPKSRRLPYILGGLLVCIPLLAVVLPLLTSADALFQYFSREILARFYRIFSLAWAGRLALGLLAAPFLYGLLYALRRPEPRKESKPMALPGLEAAGPATVLLVMDALYLLFVGVQFAGLFGGERYLAAAGISYAEYARSGFFQMVFVAAVNLILVLSCLRLSKPAGRGFQVVRLLSTGMVAMSAVMLASAAWRMSLYVGEYGLTFKRVLTYWGMIMTALFLAAALVKIWRAGFSFFKVFVTAGLIGWLVLNLANVDGIVARYNAAHLAPKAAAESMLGSYDGAGTLDALALEHPEEPWIRDLADLLRREAAREASAWETWSVSAQLAAGS